MTWILRITVALAFLLSPVMTEDAKAATTKLTFLVSISGNMAESAEAVAKAYMERNPDVFVEVEARPGGGEGDNLVKARLATGEMADVFFYNPGALFRALGPERNLVDVTSLENMQLVDKDFVDCVTVNGKIYGVPFGTHLVGGIFYNKRIYRDLGLDIPRTWDAFMENCRKIKEAGIAPVAQTYRSSWTSQMLLLADFYNLQTAVPDFAEKFTNNQAKFASTPAAVKGFERLKSLFDAKYMNPDFGAATFSDGIYMLAEGEAAHYPMLSHALAAWKQDFPERVDDIGIFPQPSDDPSVNGLTVWNVNALYIPTTSKNRDAALKFVNFVASPEGAEIFMNAGGAQGPSPIAGARLPDDTPQVVFDMLPYFEAGHVAPALEFLSPIKGPALEQITVEVGSGMRQPADAAAMYDEDVRKQAQQLGIAGW